MDLRHAYRVVRQQLEEAQDQHRGQNDANGERCDTVTFRHVLRQLERIADRAGRSDEAKRQFGANNNTWFDVHA